VGAFLLGLTYGSPYLIAGAANSEAGCEVIPAGVDERLYKEAYTKTKQHLRTKSAAHGASVAKAVLTVFIVFIISAI
jgi:hypothetical protein